MSAQCSARNKSLATHATVRARRRDQGSPAIRSADILRSVCLCRAALPSTPTRRRHPAAHCRIQYGEGRRGRRRQEDRPAQCTGLRQSTRRCQRGIDARDRRLDLAQPGSDLAEFVRDLTTAVHGLLGRRRVSLQLGCSCACSKDQTDHGCGDGAHDLPVMPSRQAASTRVAPVSDRARWGAVSELPHRVLRCASWRA